MGVRLLVRVASLTHPLCQAINFSLCFLVRYTLNGSPTPHGFLLDKYKNTRNAHKIRRIGKVKEKSTNVSIRNGIHMYVSIVDRVYSICIHRIHTIVIYTDIVIYIYIHEFTMSEDNVIQSWEIVRDNVITIYLASTSSLISLKRMYLQQ